MSLEKLAPMGQGQLHNITITGNDVTIECNDEAAIYCASCNDITIGGITFNQCGIYSQYISGLEFVNTTNIAIHNCTFQNSRIAAVTLINANGNVTVQKSNFSFSFIDNSGPCAGLCIYILWKPCF